MLMDLCVECLQKFHKGQPVSSHAKLMYWNTTHNEKNEDYMTLCEQNRNLKKALVNMWDAAKDFMPGDIRASIEDKSCSIGGNKESGGRP